MRVTQSSSVGLIATHAALTTGIHGITGVIVGTTETQTLTNKTIGAGGLTFTNEGVGDDILITCDSGSKLLKFDGYLASDIDFIFLSETAFNGRIGHAISAHRVWTFPDVAGNVIIDADTGKSVSLAQLTIENAGAGADPVFTSDSGVARLKLTGSLVVTDDLLTEEDIFFASNTAFNGTLQHTISAARTWTFPDIAGTVLLEENYPYITDIPLDEFEASSGTPTLTNETGTDTGITIWTHNAANERIRSKYTFSPPVGYTKMKVEVVARNAGGEDIDLSYSLNGAGLALLTSLSMHAGGEYRAVTSGILTVADTDIIRITLQNMVSADAHIRSVRILWSK